MRTRLRYRCCITIISLIQSRGFAQDALNAYIRCLWSHSTLEHSWDSQEACLNSCSFEGPGLRECTAGETASFRIQARDSQGYHMLAGHADFAVTVAIAGIEAPGRLLQSMGGLSPLYNCPLKWNARSYFSSRFLGRAVSHGASGPCGFLVFNSNVTDQQMPCLSLPQQAICISD